MVDLLSDAVGTTGAIIWDGDEFAEDSFTRILDKVLASHSVTAVAFYWRRMKDDFLASWGPKVARYPGGLHLVLLDELEGLEGDASWVQLGIDALRLTGSNDVLSLGGGGVVAKEAALCMEDELLKEVRWRLILLPRYPLSDTVEYGSLYEHYRAAQWSNFECLNLTVADCEVQKMCSGWRRNSKSP
eukprot:symbB.v1.2.026907.t1/scaffold2726.1/size72210/5